MIDRHSGVPVHRQVADDLRRRVAAGEWAPGAHLPAEVDLAHDYAVGIDALRQAYQALRSEGIIRGGGPGMRASVPPTPKRRVHKLAPGEDLTWRMPTPAERAEHDIPEGVPVGVLRGPGGERLLPADRWRVRSPWPTGTPGAASNHEQ